MELKTLNSILSLENLRGTFGKFKEDLDRNDTLCLSTNKGERIHIAAAIEKPIIYVAKDSYSALMTYQRMRAYCGDNVALFQPNDDLLFYRKSFQKSYAGDRIKALYDFATNKAQVLVTSAISLVQFVPKKDRLLRLVTSISVNQEIEIYTLIDVLVSLGYEREEVCEEKNTFAVHGDIIDIFLSYMSMPIRISFYGDIIENIKTYDVDSLLSTGGVDEITLYPNNDLLYTLDEIQKAIKLAERESKKLTVDGASRAEQIISDLILQSSCSQKAQWLLPFVRNSNDTLFDYLADNGEIIFDEPEAINNYLINYCKENTARVKDLSKDGEVTKLHELVILTNAELQSYLEKFKKLSFSNLSSSNTLVKPQNIIKIPSRKLNNYILHYESLLEDLRNFVRGGSMVFICQPTKERAQTLQRTLADQDIPCSYREKVLIFEPGIFLINEDIAEGFVYPNDRIVLIGTEDIIKKSNDSYKKKNTKTVFVMPQVGDYVVHEARGIGRCLGPRRVKTGEIEQDYIVVEYKNGALFYVPVSQMDKLSRYSGSEHAPKLSDIDGKDFSKLKANVKKSLKQMAINLVDLYSKRLNKKGYQYHEDNELMQAFEDAFEYEPTPDQVEAIRDIKQDMERGLIMDRLLCGDVGYGKTEVALRAVFKTILDGKQAAMLAPTTILAQQHYMTAIDRFSEFGIGVELISRLKTEKEIQQSLENIKTGKSQFVIATHRLLSKDVQFKDLGLLVLDEEQRFGVEHKEKLKVLKTNLNVLTLSATPIPRTLNMALIGVRDISVLDTSPSNRLPVQTSVTELTQALIQDTIEREISRGGQVFILYNEVKGIMNFAAMVQDLVPDAKVIYAHGQMNSEDLENRVSKFYSKEANVLVCTTIIENGIDIPDANTLIVCNADKLGLSQLYQLRGRVGRSNRLAYAYFTVDPNKVLTDTALKRLNAIMDYTELGSGFKIAMRDLEIRGAGNILGREQHGHIEKVGYDMYCKLLQECVNEIQGIQTSNVTCQIDAQINAYLDTNYVSEDNSRIKIFRDIIDSHTQADTDKLLLRLKESFGEVPNSLVNLVNIGLVRNLAQELKIENIKIDKRGMNLTFAQADFFQNEKLMLAISDLKDDAVLTNEEKPKIVFNCKIMSNVAKLEFLKQFLLKAMC